MATTTDAQVNRDSFNQAAGIPWGVASGRFLDAAGVANGSTTWPGATASVTDTDTGKTFSIDVSSIVIGAQWFENPDRTCGLIITATNAGIIRLTTKEYADTAKRMTLTHYFTDGTNSGPLLPIADSALSASSAGSLGGDTTMVINASGPDRGFGLWAKPAKAVSASFLDLWTTEQFASGGPIGLRVDQAAPSGEPAILTVNDVTGGGAMLGPLIAVNPSSLAMVSGETRRLIVTVTDSDVPVSGYTPDVSVEPLGAASVTWPASSPTTAPGPTGSDGQVAIDVTANQVGNIVLTVL